MSVLFANRFKTTLSAGVSDVATVLPLSSVTGLPAIGAGAYCYLTLVTADQVTIEVVKATAVSGNDVTVTRAQEGTAAVAWALGDPVELRLTKQSLLDALAEKLGLNATADAALELATPRTFDITGDMNWQVTFDGSANVSAAGTIQPGVVSNTMLANMAAAGLKGATAAGAVTDLDATAARTLLAISNVENKSGATIRGEITSSNVTDALGFTPEVAGVCQTADATLTALAALAWATGAQVPVFTAADTVSLRTIGVAAGTDLLDRDGGDGRYALLAGATFTGKVNAPAPTATGAGLNVGYGVAPTSNQVNGDIWATSAGMYFRVNGANFQCVTTGTLNSYGHLSNGANFTGALQKSGVDVSVVGHTHAIADVTSLQTTLDGKAPKLPQIQTAFTNSVTPTFADDLVIRTGASGAITLNNPTGTAADGWGIAVRLKDNGTARAISFGTQYRAIGVTLPTTTTVNKTLYLAMIFNSADTKWDVVAVQLEA